MAMNLGELNVHARLYCGDVRASKIYYHKTTCNLEIDIDLSSNKKRMHQPKVK